MEGHIQFRARERGQKCYVMTPHTRVYVLSEIAVVLLLLRVCPFHRPADVYWHSWKRRKADSLRWLWYFKATCFSRPSAFPQAALLARLLEYEPFWGQHHFHSFPWHPKAPSTIILPQLKWWSSLSLESSEGKALILFSKRTHRISAQWPKPHTPTFSL